MQLRKRYGLDGYASALIARWIDERLGIFTDPPTRYDDEIAVPMPRMVAMFQVDWVDPFNPYTAAESPNARYRISRAAFDKAQRIWAEAGVFVGFRRGQGVGNADFAQIDFQPQSLSDGTESRMTAEEHALLALRGSRGLPAGYFHIVVTGNTTEDETASGKSIRGRGQDVVATGSEGILLFAGTYSRLGYAQVAERGSTDQELGELLAHEIGHFLFGLGHYEPLDVLGEQAVIRDKTDIMRASAEFDPQDHLGAASRAEIDTALSEHNVPHPEWE